ncbi:QWRF motif protein (DUF566) [Rhynchospora pubera]|uniref:QWRF motif protein (DUF566) n=1 Tax=Rhynchospora pubera TaxID=906938 RepID=A0AAV8GFQ1_9POAL|nr:QWRF motif protein (DUF566) [Rhynchospora pubera]
MYTMEFSSRTSSEKRKKKQQENTTNGCSVATPSRHSFSSPITRSFQRANASPLKDSSYSSPRPSFCTETACRKPSPRRGASAWALSPGRSLDMTETPVPRRKSVDCGRVGGGMGSVMGLFARRKKVDPVEEETVHQLRITLAQLMQWRFINARAGAAMDRQRFVSERKLFYVWLRLAEMRNVVTAKQVLLQRGRIKVKLQSLLVPQVKLLMKWEQVARPHVDAVAVLGKVLGATCLSVPLVEGAQANIVSLHRCLRVTMDVMKDIEAKARTFYSNAETVRLLFVELTKTILSEIEGLQELINLSQKILLLQMEEVSLRTNLIQATKEEDNKLALSKPLAVHRYMTLRPVPASIMIDF